MGIRRWGGHHFPVAAYSTLADHHVPGRRQSPTRCISRVTKTAGDLFVCPPLLNKPGAGDRGERPKQTACFYFRHQRLPRCDERRRRNVPSPAAGNRSRIAGKPRPSNRYSRPRRVYIPANAWRMLQISSPTPDRCMLAAETAFRVTPTPGARALAREVTTDETGRCMPCPRMRPLAVACGCPGRRVTFPLAAAGGGVVAEVEDATAVPISTTRWCGCQGPDSPTTDVIRRPTRNADAEPAVPAGDRGSRRRPRPWR